MQVNEVEIQLFELDTALKLLAQNHSVPLNRLTNHPKLKDAYDRVKYAVVTFHGGPAYSIVRQHISRLTRPHLIENETIGSYIWGCIQDCYGDVDRYCSPLCINSIPPETNERPTCQHHIITREVSEEGSINVVCLNCDKNGDHINTAIVYSDEDIDALTGQELRFIKGLGISQVSIMVRDGLKYARKMDMTPIDRLDALATNSMIPKGYVASPYNLNMVEESKPSHSNSMRYTTWFAIFLFILLMILVVYIFL